MSRSLVQAIVIALIFLAIGGAGTAGVLAFLPDPGSPPSIYDDFQWSSEANGFWHVNAVGASATIKNSLLTLKGHQVELDHRIQTDPSETVLAVKIRADHFHKFGLGIGVYHAGTVGLEFDNDGVKCGRGTDVGWKVDIMKAWTTPPANQWFYLYVSVRNPYPDPKVLLKAEKLAEARNDKTLLRPVTLTCAMYDSRGKLIASDTPKDPPANAHYVSFDEAFIRTWDSGNSYQLDWLYAGPPSGNPIRSLVSGLRTKTV